MLVYLMCNFASYLFSRTEQYTLSGIVLILAAIYLYVREYMNSCSLINLKGIFSLAFVGGEGLAAMKLSYLAEKWSVITWISLSLAFVCFYTVFEIMKRYMGSPYESRSRRLYEKNNENRMYVSIIILSLISAIAFNIEAVLLGFIPFFEKGVPHAYSYFHISGLHYFTVSCILVPAFSIIYLSEEKKPGFIKTVFLIAANIISLAIPVLCVSRFQFLMAVLLGFVTLLVVKRDKINPLMFAAVIALTVPVYLILSVARSHDVSYLNGIFEMKYDLPIFISQPYIYIANNYDNLDTLIKELPAHSMGLKGMFPLWALSGLKFIYRELVDFPLYVNKTELTTVTVIYDAYYDFGIPGVGMFSGLLGAVSYFFEKWIRNTKNIASYVLYGQFFMYLGLSFFTTWFSNPTTWFYFAVSAAVCVFCRRKGGLYVEGQT